MKVKFWENPAKSDIAATVFSSFLFFQISWLYSHNFNILKKALQIDHTNMKTK